MKKSKTSFFCQHCDYMSLKWLSKCPSCNGWNCFAEELISDSDSSSRTEMKFDGKPLPIEDISVEEGNRTITGLAEIDSSVVVPSLEGTRPILVEIKALVSATNLGMPRRTAIGVDHNRVSLFKFTAAVLRSAQEFDALKNEWENLLERSDATVFQSYEWQRSWWRFFGETNKACQLFLVAIRDGGRLITLAPCFIERLSLAGLLSVRCLQLVGREVTDYLNIICERDYEILIMDTLVGVLVSLKDHFDVVALEDIPHTSRFHKPLHEGFLAAGFVGTYFQNAQCLRTSLQESWESTLETFTKKHKKDVSYELRNIHRNFTVELEVTASRNTVHDNVEDFIAMHQERWMLAGHPGVFHDTQQADFHRSVALQCYDRGWLFLAFLRLNGRRVAVNYGFRFRGTLSTYLNGMIDLGDMAKFSPGKVLHELSMQEGIKHGMQIYDFMRGRERYKYALNGVDVPNWTILMYRDGSFFIKRKFNIHLLTASLKRRIRKETSMVRHVANEHGWFSPSMGRHLSARLMQNIRDSVQKVKEPEKSLE